MQNYLQPVADSIVLCNGVTRVEAFGNQIYGNLENTLNSDKPIPFSIRFRPDQHQLDFALTGFSAFTSVEQAKWIAEEANELFSIGKFTVAINNDGQAEIWYYIANLISDFSPLPRPVVHRFIYSCVDAVQFVQQCQIRDALIQIGLHKSVASNFLSSILLKTTSN